MNDARRPRQPVVEGEGQGVDARVLDSMDVEEHLRDPARKQAFVTSMFDVIAPKYDLFTRRFSFGMDVRWKEELIAHAVEALPVRADGGERGGGSALDVACGTGDLAFALARERPSARILAIDVSPQMIAHAAQRTVGLSGATPLFRVADLMQLELPDASLDLVTGGYALRNVPDWRAGLGELARVLRPGGRLVTLDFYRPQRALWRALYLGYLRVAGDLVGLRWHGRAVVYGYIARSIRDFTSWQEYSAELSGIGFRDVYVRTHLLGGVALHVATRA